MPDDRSNLPVSLDRSALDRVMARAAELQARAAEPSESMTEAELVALAKEVGIPPEHIRQALAEERTRVALPPPESGESGGWFGPEAIGASRVVRGRPAELLQQLDAWMQREECLQPRRRFAERMTWEPRGDFGGALRRAFNVGGRGYPLSGSTEVGATVVAVDDARSMVRLDASLSDGRRRAITAGTASAGTSAVAGAGVLGVAAAMPGGSMAVAAIVAIASVTVGLSGLAMVSSGQRKAALRVQMGLEQVLDRLEHGEMRKVSTVADIIAAVTRPR